MRNNEERRQFVEDINNWELAESTIWTQTLKLTYKGHEWYQIRVLENSERYDYKVGRFRKSANWENHMRYYKVNPDVGLDLVSKANIINEIKEIDKKEKTK